MRTYHDPYGTPYTLVHRAEWDEPIKVADGEVFLININDPDSQPILITDDPKKLKATHPKIYQRGLHDGWKKRGY